MANTRLADLIQYPEFGQAIIQRAQETNAFFKSGAMTYDDPEINTLAASPAKLIQLPFFKDLGNTAANRSTDVETDRASPGKIGMGQDQAVKHFLNNHWSVSDLARELAAKDPMKAITDQVGDYWAGEYSRILISSMTGMLADNIANDAKDMVYDVTITGTQPLAGAALTANRFNADNFIMAEQTMGDKLGGLVAIAVHSSTFATMRRQGLITAVTPQDGTKPFNMYGDKRIIIDDQMPVIANGAGNAPIMISALIGAGAFAFGDGKPVVPEEVSRDPLAANGGGVETFTSRKTVILHPRGVKFTQTSQAGITPTLTELQAAANWDRVYNRKQLRFAFIRHYQ